ncbi:MAG: NlpC/P60 family protein [Ginsengibacter sp.]
MNGKVNVLFILTILFLASCSSSRKTTVTKSPVTKADEIKSTVKIKKKVPVIIINTRDVLANNVVDFAEKLKGVRYTYGSSDKDKGFDCSGFITYVFKEFNIPVPRISYDFTNVGREISIKDCRRGDIILFTGSDPNSGIVGHMGIVTSNQNNEVEFIHASSSRGVMISGMNSYFVPRFVKVNRIFKN